MRAGKLKFDRPSSLWIDQALSADRRLELLALSPRVAMGAAELEWQDECPADRIIVATAQLYESPLATYDTAITNSGWCAVFGNDGAGVAARPEAARRDTAALARGLLFLLSGADLLGAGAARAASRASRARRAHARARGASDLAARLEPGAAPANAVPHGRHHVIPAAGHLANLDDPPGYAAAIREFVDGPSAKHPA